MESEAIETAALGRPLHPGMLYDCRSETFIPGVTLWDQAAIDKDMNVKPQPNTCFHYVASDSITEKTDLMDVSASLKASFLAGLVEVGGSGSYLKDTLSSMRQCRVTMQYKQTTEFKHLTMAQLGHVTYPEVFDQKTATHVVTAVLYGAEAFMVFDQMSSDEKDKQDIQGNMDVMIKKIPTIEISGSGKVVMTDEEKKKVENFNCTFHGDVTLEQNPSTYEEAVLVYKELPKLLGADGSKAVPVRVWLYPLTNLDSKAAQLVREICTDQVTRLEAVMGQLHEAEMRANDSIKRCLAIKATDVTDKLYKFQDKRTVYTETLLQNISKVLPAIREGTAEEQKLVNILKFHEESSFTHDKMKKWLDDKESEIGVLESYISPLKKIPIVPHGPEMNKVLFDPQNETVYIFNFTSLQYEEPYLSNLHECLNSTRFKKMEEISVARDLSFKEEALPWFRNPDVSERMRNVLEDFKSYMNDPAYRCISYKSNTPFHGASIFMYDKGDLIQKL
ncbi:stonustoxin subunit alpha-like [Anguilla rostrata]|uniref:stonustoxin subunit alpha-like n=1 Tax=Anguilla rostrata TaxID=7938 RepID=UPI0030CFFCEE